MFLPQLGDLCKRLGLQVFFIFDQHNNNDSTVCPVDGSACTVGKHRGLILSAKAWGAHGRAHYSRDRIEAARAASFVSAPSVDLTEAQLTSVPPERPPREALAALDSVDLGEALAPGQRTVQYIPRPLKQMSFAAFSFILSHCMDTPRITIGASKALATFAFFGLGADKAAVEVLPGAAGVSAEALKARAASISRQLGLIAHGRFSEVAAAAADRVARGNAAAATASSVSVGGAEDLSAPGALSPGTIRAVNCQNALGNHGKAVDKLIPAPSADYSEPTFELVNLLHQPERHAIDQALLSVEVEPVVATPAALIAVLGKLRRGVAAGVSGLTNDHLRSLFPADTEPEQAALGPLLRFVNMVLAAKVDEETADWLCASVLVTLYKPDGLGGLKVRDDGRGLDVRPIAIPETLYRLVSLCGLHMCKDAISAKLAGVRQLGVGVSSGPEAIATAVRLYMGEITSGVDEEEASERLISVCLSADATNAFNTVDRDAVLRMVLEVCPGLLPFVRMSYRRQGRLVLANRGPGKERYRVFLSRSGVRQGDPLGPVLFALAAMEAMRKVQAAHPDVPLPSYADDVNGLIRARGAQAAADTSRAVYATLRKEFGAIGIGFNSKTALLCPADASVGALAGITQKPGLALMGVPVGPPDFMLATVEKRLSVSFQQLRLLPQLDFGVALQLLRFCISPRVAYLAGQLPDIVVGAFAVRWDAAIVECLTSMFRCPPPARCFVSGAGGLDISLLVGEMHTLRLNGWARAKATIDAFLPELGSLTSFSADSAHPVHAEVSRAWHALPPAVSGADGVVSPFAAPAAPTSAPPPSTLKAAVVAAQRKLSTASSNSRRSHIRAGLTPMGRLLWERASGKGAKQWLNMAPLYAARKLTSDQYRVATSIWLFGGIAELGGLVDPSGRSLMRTDGAGRVRRHGGLAQTYADLGIEAGHRVWMEARVFPEFSAAMSVAARGGVASGSLRRMDVLTIPSGALTGLAIDPTVQDPASPDRLRRWCSSADAPCPLELEELVKRAHYVDLPPAWRLFPCGHGTQGDMGPGAHACVNELTLLIATRRNGGQPPARALVDAVRRELYGRLVLSLMRELADQIITKFGADPRVGLSKDNAYVHSSYRPWAAGARSPTCVCESADAARPGCVCNGVRGPGRRRGE